MTSQASFEFVESLCQEALVAYNLSGWEVRWDRAKRRAGYCSHRDKAISFSRVLVPLYPVEVLRDVVLHEVAHAIAGPRAAHGAAWKKVAQELGATPKAMLPNWLPAPPAEWVGRCPRCNAERKLHASPRRVVACGRCSKTFREDLIFEWEHLGTRVTPGGSYGKELARIRRTARK